MASGIVDPARRLRSAERRSPETPPRKIAPRRRTIPCDPSNLWSGLTAVRLSDVPWFSRHEGQPANGKLEASITASGSNDKPGPPKVAEHGRACVHRQCVHLLVAPI